MSMDFVDGMVAIEDQSPSKMLQDMSYDGISPSTLKLLERQGISRRSKLEISNKKSPSYIDGAQILINSRFSKKSDNL